MKTIYKYPITSALNPVSRAMIMLPKNSKILTVQIQNNQICIWAEVDTEESLITKEFSIVGTGNPFPTYNVIYIGTVQAHPYVWHVYESIF